MKLPKFKQPVRSQDSSQRPGIILFVSLLPNNSGWLFQWPSTGAAYYRIVLQGTQISIVQDTTHGMQTYVYDGPGFETYPPPLEIMQFNTQAPSEINEPFIVIQWYGESTADYYQLQEYISGSWTLISQIEEVGADFYTWTSPILVDGSTHLYQVIAFNSLGQGSAATAYNATPVVTPPFYDESEYTITYDNTGHNLVLDLA